MHRSPLPPARRAAGRAGLSALACTLACALASTLPARAASTPTADELAAKNLEARGGAAPLQAMQSLRLTGTLIVGDGQFQMALVQTLRRPGALRSEATVQGMTQVEAWDGHEGWHIDPFGGRKDPERLSLDDAKWMAESAADFDGALVDWKAKGLKLDYLGVEDVDGTLAHKIRATRANGDVEVVWLDPEHFLEIRLLSQRMERGAKVETEVDLGDYEKVAGVWLPMAVESGRKGSSSRQKFIIKTAEVNVKTDDAMFSFPAKEAK